MISNETCNGELHVWKNSPRIIGLAGRKRSGKDTVGGMIYDSAPERFAVVAFAKKLKDICIDVYAFTPEQIYGELKEVPDNRYPRPDGTFLTPREAMEKCGTEFARSCYPDTWADLGMRQTTEYTGRGISVVITDVRFCNEGQKILDAGGEIWRVYRRSADSVISTHPAETEMDTPEFNDLVKVRIYNNNTLDELRNTVLQLLSPAKGAPP